jgi:hypothetical protein
MAERAGAGRKGGDRPGAGRLLRRARKRWRAWLRALHRDAGYLLVGLTFVYAASGIAINHIDDWNPNFESGERVHQLGPLPEERQAATEKVVAALELDGEPQDAYMAAPHQLEIYWPDRTLHVDTDTGQVVEEWEEPRFFLRVANWLHYNRGKAAWTYVADGYAVMLLLLATSGAFMLKGRKGLVGRGAVLILAGTLVPVLYVHFSGGPGG